MLKICRKESVNLPFGLDTTLHISIADRLRRNLEYKQYFDDEENPADNFGYIDVNQNDPI